MYLFIFIYLRFKVLGVMVLGCKVLGFTVGG